MISAYFLKFLTFLWLLLPPTPACTELVGSGYGLTFLSSTKMEAQPLPRFLQKTHTTKHSESVDSVGDIEGQGEIYTVETPTTSMWLLNNPVRTKQKPLATGLEDVLFISCFALNILPDPFPFLLPPLCLLTLPSSHTQLQALLSIMHSYSVLSSPKPPDWLLTLAGAELNKRTFHPNLIHSSYQAVVLVDS